jgi:hypothetical protein
MRRIGSAGLVPTTCCPRLAVPAQFTTMSGAEFGRNCSSQTLDLLVRFQ